MAQTKSVQGKGAAAKKAAGQVVAEQKTASVKFPNPRLADGSLAGPPVMRQGLTQVDELRSVETEICLIEARRRLRMLRAQESEDANLLAVDARHFSGSLKLDCDEISTLRDAPAGKNQTGPAVDLKAGQVKFRGGLMEAQTSTPQQVPELPNLNGQLQNRLIAGIELVDSVMQVLKPVLRAEDGNSKMEGPSAAPVLTELGSAFAAAIDRAEMINGRLRSILARLEV